MKHINFRNDKEFLQNELTGNISTKWAGQPVCVYESIDSTNLEAARLSKNGAGHGTVVVAQTQTAGRGRRGRSWESPKGSNLYFSLLLRPKTEPVKAPMLTLVMAVALARAINQTAGCDVGIKWPNDLVADGRKLCGVLTEMHLQKEKPAIEDVIIGVGINVSDCEWPEELRDKATSLERVCGRLIAPGKLWAQTMLIFEELYEEFILAGDLTPIMETYNGLLVNLGREVTVLDPKGDYRGVAVGITPTGELVVETADGERREVFAGEVSVRGIYGYV